MLPLRATVVLSALPLAVLGGLALLGELAWAAAAVAAVIVVAGAAGLARLWMRDLALVVRALRHAATGEEPPARAPVLAATAHIVREAGKLSQHLAEHARAVDGRLQAEQAIVQRLPDPLIVLARDRSVQRANAAAHRAFGAEMSAVLRHPGLRGAIDRALAQGEDQTAELSLPVPVAREVSATVMAMNPPLADGGRVVATLSDRTRERAVERMRADFVANASHELRTPLASLIGFIDTLRGPARDDPPAQVRFLAIMAEQAQRMNRLIDDLLSLSRIELTEHQPPGDEVDLGALARVLEEVFGPQLTARRIRLDLQLPDAPPVVGDEDQLQQVLQNLLENAVKYGREGGTVQVAVQAAAPGGRWPARPGVTLAVADDGQGIARAHIPRLTERFYRADKGRSRAVGGTGLGLAIVKHIVNRHRGQMAIESTEGVGTTVTVWLPAAALPPQTGPGLDSGAAATA